MAVFKITDDDSPVIVQLIGNGLVRNLALPPNEERALVVGSTARADFHVDGVRVAPVQFHLERYEGAVWLIPAYGIKDLRLNSAPVLGPAQLEEHNVIKFAGVYLEATIRDADAFAASGDSLFDDTPSNREVRASYPQELPDEADETQPAIRALAVSNAPEDEWLTTEIQPLSVKHLGDDAGRFSTELQSNVETPKLVRTHSTEQLDDRSADITLHGTRLIPRYQPIPGATETSGLPPRGPTSKWPEPVQEDARAVDTVRLVPLRNAPRPQFVPPRPAPAKPAGTPPPKARVDGPPHSSRTVSPTPLGRHPLSFPASTAELPLHRRTAVKTMYEPAETSLLARLGLLAKARPLLAGCFGGFGAAVIALLLLAVTRLAATRSTSSTTRPAAGLVASFSALRPAAVTKDAKTPVPVRALASAPVVQVGDAQKHP